MPSKVQMYCSVFMFLYIFLREILQEAMFVLLATTAPLVLAILSPALQALFPSSKD